MFVPGKCCLASTGSLFQSHLAFPQFVGNNPWLGAQPSGSPWPAPALLQFCHQSTILAGSSPSSLTPCPLLCTRKWAAASKSSPPFSCNRDFGHPLRWVYYIMEKKSTLLEGIIRTQRVSTVKAHREGAGPVKFRGD